MKRDRRKIKRLGEGLVEAGVLTSEQVQMILEEQKESQGRFGEVAVKLGLVDEDLFFQELSRQIQIPLIDLSQLNLDRDTIYLLPESYARTYQALVIEQAADHIVVAMSDPSDLNAQDVLARVLPLPVEPVLITTSALGRLHDLHYRNDTVFEQIADQVEELSQEEKVEERGKLEQVQRLSSDNSPTAQMVELMFENAMRLNASDIHIEPDEKVLRIRTRVDGVLREQVLEQKKISTILSSRLKTMAGLDVSERRLPQDGHFNLELGEKRVDVRLSTMPVQYGESVVMRLLDQSRGMLQMSELGMPPAMMERFRHEVGRPHGMVLVTGPTGSGKTTTLYSALNERNSPDEKIVTVEDPVEYRLPRVNQVQVNTRIGLDFHRVLRAMLRQDPDVVLIGEIRDEESMEIGLRAAMTGHLVLSTLHTNDAISTVSRLIEMGGRGYLLASTLRVVVAQRLIRRNCPRCQEKVTLEPHQQRWVDMVIKDESAVRNRFIHGTGCSYCEQTGYRGRIGVFEIIEIDHQLRADLNREDMDAFEVHARSQRGYRSMISSAIELVLSGVTSVEEVMRVMDDLSLSFFDMTQLPGES